jgi:hypothetical protein
LCNPCARNGHRVLTEHIGNGLFRPGTWVTQRTNPAQLDDCPAAPVLVLAQHLVVGLELLD